MPVYRRKILNRSAFLGENEYIGGGETALSPEPRNHPAEARAQSPRKKRSF